MNVKIKQVDGITLLGKADSSVWIPMDGPADFGGSEAGVRPIELVLIGLGGCTSMDVISMLKKMRQSVTNFEVDITAERGEEHPKVFTEIHVHYTIHGSGIDKAKVERAIELSETKYCGVSAILRETAKITSDYEIVEA